MANVSGSTLTYLNKAVKTSKKGSVLQSNCYEPHIIIFPTDWRVSEADEMPTQDQHSPFRNTLQYLRSWNSALTSSQAHSQGPFGFLWCTSLREEHAANLHTSLSKRYETRVSLGIGKSSHLPVCKARSVWDAAGNGEYSGNRIRSCTDTFDLGPGLLGVTVS